MAEGSREVALRVALTRAPLEPEHLLRDLGSHGDGAVTLFLGRVREVNEGRPVVRLSYEAYREMAEAELGRIVREVAQAHEVGEIVALHRVGALELGEASVAIAVAAPHRAPCYAASRAVIEEIKERLPVWKKEEYADGTVAWVGAPGNLPGPPGRAEPEEAARGGRAAPGDGPGGGEG